MQDEHRKNKTAPEDGGTTRARTRVSRACTRCRARKDKCDGGTPACLNCVTSEAVCIYDAATKKRGLPEGYVRAVEKLWAVSFSRIEGLEDALIGMLQQERELLTSIWNQREVGEELHARWKDSRIFQELEAFLAGVESNTAATTTGTKRKREQDDEGDRDDAVKDLATLLPPRYALCDVAQKDLYNQSISTTRTPSTNTFKLPSASSELLSRYFNSIHASFPILDRPKLLRSCYEQTRNGTQVGEFNDELAVLAAALACTARSQVVGSDLGVDPNTLFNISKQCLPTLSGTFKIGHVQALLLLCLADIHDGEWESAWRSVGFAARVLNDLIDKGGGMSRDQTAARQGCLVLDTLIGVRLRRRPQCRRDDLPSSAYLREDVSEEWEPWQGTSEPAFIISCFNNLTKLAGILSDFVCQLPGTPVPARDRTDQALGNLNTLAASYPRGARLTAAEKAPPHQVFLKAAHLLTTAFVTASHPDHVHSTIPPLAAAKKTFDDAKAATGCFTVPAWLTGLFAAVLHDLNGLPEGASLLSSPSHVALFRGLHEHLNTNAPRAFTPVTGLENGHSVGPAPEQSALLSEPSKRPSQSRRSFFPADPFAQPMNMVRSPPTPSVASVNANTSNMFSQTPQDFFTGGIDIPTGPSMVQGGGIVMPVSHDSSHALYNPSVATSPSFQGDEIDALFHEMAQLDTTEWATGRNEGLKDFGFNDIEAFEQFCNDPDRLFAGNFTNSQQQQPQSRHMSEYSTADFNSRAFDMTGQSSWNG